MSWSTHDDNFSAALIHNIDIALRQHGVTAETRESAVVIVNNLKRVPASLEGAARAENIRKEVTTVVAPMVNGGSIFVRDEAKTAKVIDAVMVPIITVEKMASNGPGLSAGPSAHWTLEEMEPSHKHQPPPRRNGPR